MSRIPAVLSIAGSDSGGGAGIQADLKAFARCGVHGMTAITALTAQNTVGVDGDHPVPPELIVEQVRAVADDIGVDAVKIGMLGTAETIDAVATALDLRRRRARRDRPGDGRRERRRAARRAAAPGAGRASCCRAPPWSRPNLPEARVLAGRRRGRRARSWRRGARTRSARAAVVVTGGHRDEATDVFFDGEDAPTLIPGERHPDGAAHGSGCTHSSALAAHLALGSPARGRRAPRADSPRGRPRRPARASARALARSTCSG